MAFSVVADRPHPEWAGEANDFRVCCAGGFGFGAGRVAQADSRVVARLSDAAIAAISHRFELLIAECNAATVARGRFVLGEYRHVFDLEELVLGKIASGARVSSRQAKAWIGSRRVENGWHGIR